MKRITFAVMMMLALAGWDSASADEAAAFFDDTVVREIRITFADSNWYTTLYQSHASDPDDPYFPARFQCGDVVLEPVGVRFKGNASFRRSGTKKSFKIDFNEYQDETTFLGLKKLNLNNGDLQPDFLREKLFLDFAGKLIPAMRAVHVRLVVNDELQGLFVGVEQPDKTMMRDRFGGDEDGNLFEAGEAGADLTYRGADPASYYSLYELKTNEEANDYSDLIELLDALNNTSAAELPSRLEPICDVENMLTGLALNILFTNLDSYLGSASEFYLYHRQDTGQFVHLHWDLNESFGTTGDGSPMVSNPMTLDPFWVPTGGGGPGQPPGLGGSRPLATRLWAVEAYKRTYLRILARMLREGFDTTTMAARVNELAGIIRTEVYADPKKLFTNAQFETALTSQVRAGGQSTIYGLDQFVRGRVAYLRPVLDSCALPTDLRLNEVALSGTLTDGSGDAGPWLEIHNLGPGTVTTSGMFLSDDPATPRKWALPVRTIADGGFLVVWLDGEPSEGDDHATFRLQAAGGNLSLCTETTESSSSSSDSVEVPALAAGRSLIRLGSSGSQWEQTASQTPGATNPTSGVTTIPGVEVLRINEVMADNDTTVEDPDEAGAFEDWIEVFNPGSTVVDLGGLYLTDDLATPTKWQVPAGVTVPAGGFVVFWADDETSQGSRHAAFKLSASGEAVGLYQSDGITLLDSTTFGEQTTDVAIGRYPDGGATWTTMNPATPGAANRVDGTATPVTLAWVPVATHAAGANASQWRTDLGVLNPGTASASVELRFHAASGVKTGTVAVPAGAQSILVDVVDQLGTTGSAALEVRADQLVHVTSRTYDEVSETAACMPGGTLGQDYAAYAPAAGLAAGEAAWLPQLAESTQYRSNIALVNTGSAVATVAVTLFDGSGVQVGSYAVELEPGAYRQENRPFATHAGQTAMDRGYASVSVTTGSGVLVLGSVVDNVTNDPTTVVAVRRVGTGS